MNHLLLGAAVTVRFAAQINLSRAIRCTKALSASFARFLSGAALRPLPKRRRFARRPIAFAPVIR